jgi:virginiamycin B lyase
MPYRLDKEDHSALRRLALVLALCTASTLGLAQTVTEFAVPTAPPTDLYSMCLGPDGAIWFGEARTAKIGRIASDGTITEFSTQGSPAYQMTAGPDGNLWIAYGGGVGRLTPTGQFTAFPLPEAGNVIDIAGGPDGGVWFADHDGKRIGRITPAGDITLYPLPMGLTPIEPYAITLGPDGNLWFADRDHDVIGRVTPSGIVTTFPVPGSHPADLIAGPDGGIWFGGNGIGRISMSGQVTKVAPQFAASHMAAGRDGNVWFTDYQAIYRITPAGAVTRFDTPASVIYDLVAGLDGKIWFTDNATNKIARLDPSSGTPLCVADEHTLCLNHNRFAVTAGWQGTPLGPVAQATAVPLTDESGYFWFLEPGNIEVVVKVLNACADPWNAYWVFAAGLTNLGVTIDVKDMLTGAHQTYTNLLGTPFQPILDVSALKACP